MFGFSEIQCSQDTRMSVSTSKPPSTTAQDATGAGTGAGGHALQQRLADLEIRIAAAYRDVSARQAAELAYIELFERLSEAVIVHSEGEIVYLNDTAAKALGHNGGSDRAGRVANVVADPASVAALSRLAEEVKRGAGDPVRSRLGPAAAGVAEIEATAVDFTWRGRSATIMIARLVKPRLPGVFAPPSGEPSAPSGHEPYDGLWDWDLATGEIYLSGRLKAMLGYRDEAPASIGEWAALIHPDDSATHDRLLREHLDGRIPVYETDLRVRQCNGGYVWLHSRGKAARDSSGRARRIAGFNRRIAAPQAREPHHSAPLQETGGEALLIAVMNAAGLGLARFDAEDRLVRCNEAYRANVPEIADKIVLGTTFEEILWARVAAGVLPEADDDPEGWVQRRLAEHRNPQGGYVARLSDGRYFQITELKAVDGGTVIIRTDITQIVTAEQDLQARVGELETAKSMLEQQSAKLKQNAEEITQARDEADSANRTKSEFLANMSHELRTPLNAVMGFSEVIMNQSFGPVGLPQYIDYARDIYSSGAHLLEIINDILDLSKVEAGKLELVEEEIVLNEVAAAVIQLVKSRAEAGGVALVEHVPDDLPTLYADKRKLKQMLLNLLSNAIKFTRDEGTVDLRAYVDAAGAVCVAVRDTGIGIAEDQFDLVLSPFGQVDSALAREHQGTGLGLPLVKALIELHGGAITIDSEPQKGTTVTLTFPVERSMRSEGDEPSA